MLESMLEDSLPDLTFSSSAEDSSDTSSISETTSLPQIVFTRQVTVQTNSLATSQGHVRSSSEGNASSWGTATASIKDEVSSTTSTQSNESINGDASSTTSERINSLIKDVYDADDAQRVFPAEACVFVASLPRTYTNEVLKTEVERVFGKFGKVFAKVWRSKTWMPVAFCQFTVSDVYSETLR